MLERGAPEGIRPTNVAWVTTTELLTTKSSAVSVCWLPGAAGRERVAIFPSGSPVEKKKGAADAREATRKEASAPSVARRGRMSRGVAGALFVFFVLSDVFFIDCIAVCLFSRN